MNDYTKRSLQLLNGVFYNDVGYEKVAVMLAGDSRPEALKCLKLLILTDVGVVDCKLKNKLDLNQMFNFYKMHDNRRICYQKNLFGVLSTNPQNLALDLMEYLLYHYDVLVEIRSDDDNCTYSMIDEWMYGFSGIEDDGNIFYKRYDMVEKRLQLLAYIIKNKKLSIEFMEKINLILTDCINNGYGYSDVDIVKMRLIVEYVKFKQKLTSLLNKGVIKFSYPVERVYKTFGVSVDDIIDNGLLWNNLDDYDVGVDEYSYMRYDVLKLIKKRDY